jgi:hypothetical protein
LQYHTAAQALQRERARTRDEAPQYAQLREEAVVLVVGEEIEEEIEEEVEVEERVGAAEVVSREDEEEVVEREDVVDFDMVCFCCCSSSFTSSM